MSQKASLTKLTGSHVARICVCVFLVVVTWLVFGGSLWHGFINYDDPVYVYENPVVTGGLTLHGIGWAFTHSHGGNWHPLTSISHMVDCQLYGLKAGGHHFTNVLLHTIAVLLLFVLLRQMTGALWRSAFVAAVFAIHPLHVESVAWVAERKDVLSGVFFMLTLLAYVRYTRGPSLWRYATMLVLFGCGLMAKPMLVTVPFVLLLLDYWPLNRFPSSAPNWSRIGQLILEKIPLLVLSIGSCIATLLTQEKALGSIKHFPLALRAGNALVSCLSYIRQMIWPVGLTPFYPYPGNGVPAWEVILASAVLLIITGTVFAFRKTRPYLITGWFWYLGMLVPVIGVIQVGLQGHADRYTYLPQIGLYILIAWAMVDLARSWRYRQQILFTGGITTIAVLAWCAWNQASYWHDSETLWIHTLAVNPNNDVAHNNLGNAVLQKGQIDKAIFHYQKVLEIRPGHKETNRREAYYNLGNALLRKNEIDEAIVNYRNSLEGPSEYAAEAHNNLGNALLQKGQIDEAILHFERFVQLRPDHAEAYYDLGNALLQKGRVDEAVVHFEKALKLNPVLAEAENNLGNALLRKGQIDEAILHFQKYLELCSNRGEKDQAEGHYNLGTALVQKGQTSEAIAHYREAVKLRPDYAEAQNNLASALLQKGLVDEAIPHFRKVLELRSSQGESKRAEAYYKLANALLQKGLIQEAITHYGQALDLTPQSVPIQSQLAWVLATCADESLRNGSKAIELARQADQLSGGKNPFILRTLAAAYAEGRQFPHAIQAAQNALELATFEGNSTLEQALKQEITQYQGGAPYHEAQ